LTKRGIIRDYFSLVILLFSACTKSIHSLTAFCLVLFLLNTFLIFFWVDKSSYLTAKFLNHKIKQKLHTDNSKIINKHFYEIIPRIVFLISSLDILLIIGVFIKISDPLLMISFDCIWKREWFLDLYHQSNQSIFNWAHFI
jgi:hypothetical protein